MARDKRNTTQHGRSAAVAGLDGQREARESLTRPWRKSERPIVRWKPGNSGGGKRPHFQTSIQRSDSQEIDDESRTSPSGWETPEGAACQSEECPNYRFYALNDKVYRHDVLAQAYERCLQNQGAAGVDGQMFEDIEKYGVIRWLNCEDA